MDVDGEIEKRTKEEIDGETYFKAPDGTCGARLEDGIGFWCRLMNGKDPHEYAN